MSAAYCPTCGMGVTPGSSHWHTGPIEAKPLRVEANDGMRQLAIPPDCDAVAAAVSKEHPSWSPARRLSRAMQLTKGSANPHTMRAAIAAHDGSTK